MLPFARHLYPELLRLPERSRGEALRRAAREPFDFLELIGMAASLVLVTALTRYGTDHLSLVERFGMAAANFAIAIPMLAAALAPFHVRRVRRGLREELRRGGGRDAP
jgi:hypothetical protein